MASIRQVNVKGAFITKMTTEGATKSWDVRKSFPKWELYRVKMDKFEDSQLGFWSPTLNWETDLVMKSPEVVLTPFSEPRLLYDLFISFVTLNLFLYCIIQD